MNEHRQESTVWAADLLGLFARSLRRLWWLCLVLIVLCTALFGGYARLSYRAQYTASITFLVNAGGTAQSGTSTATAAQMAKTFPYILTSGLLDSAVCADTGPDGAARDLRDVGGGHEPVHAERDRHGCAAVL